MRQGRRNGMRDGNVNPSYVNALQNALNRCRRSASAHRQTSSDTEAHEMQNLPENCRGAVGGECGDQYKELQP